MSDKLADIFLKGISDFWLRFFEDSFLLKDLSKASLNRIGRQYKRLLSTMSMNALIDMPVAEELTWEPIFVASSDILKIDGSGDAEDVWLWPLPATLRGFKLLHNTPLKPTRALEADYDFEVILAGSNRLLEFQQRDARVDEDVFYVAFFRDPFAWDYDQDANGVYLLKPIPGFATGALAVELKGSFAVSGDVDLLDNGGTPILPGDTLRVQFTDGTVLFSEILSVETTAVVVVPRGQFVSDFPVLEASIGTTSPLYKDKIQDLEGVIESVVYEDRTLSAWAPIALVDDFNMYEIHGVPFSPSKVASSETYRNFLLAHWKLFVDGPNLVSMEAALNVISGYEVFRLGDLASPAEEVLSIVIPQGDTGTVLVTTSEGTYTYVYGTPLKSEVLFAALEVNGITRDESLTVFTDLNPTIEFYSQGIREGMTLKVYDTGNPFAPNVYTLSYATDSYVRVPTATPFVTDALDWEWEIYDGAVLLLAGSSGRKAQDTRVPYTPKAFSALTEVFTITDEVHTPEWWLGTVIPQPLAPNLPVDLRRVTPNLYENTIGNPATLRVGDLGWIIGRSDENTLNLTEGYRYLLDFNVDFLTSGVVNTDVLTVGGDVRTISEVGKHWVKIQDFTAFLVPAPGITAYDPIVIGNFTSGVAYTVKDVTLVTTRVSSSTSFLWTRPGLRHELAYVLMDRYLKHNMFSAAFDASNQQVMAHQTDILALIGESKPAHTYPFVEPGASLRDIFPTPITSAFQVGLEIPFEQVTGIQNLVVIGGRQTLWFEDSAENVDFVGTGSEIGGFVRVFDYDGLGTDIDMDVEWIAQLSRTTEPGVVRNRFQVEATDVPLGGFTGKSFKVYNSVAAEVHNAPGATGSMIGGIGTPGWIVGGADPLIDSLELTRTTDEIPQGANPGDLSPPGLPAGVANVVLLKQFRGTDFVTLYDNDVGRTLSTDKHLMYASDSIIEVTTTPFP
jgi:hypothetical protein